MLYSMTGYGEAQYESEGMSFLVEVRSLNNRFLKTSIRLPDALTFAESEIDKIIRQKLARGSVNIILHLKNISNSGPYEVNQNAFQGYMNELQKILTLEGKSPISIDLATLLQLPGVCQARQYSRNEQEKLLAAVIHLTREGLDRLRKMRAEEGKTILADLEKNCDQIKYNLDALEKLTDEVLQQYHQRIEQRVNELLSRVNMKFDEESLNKEVALFAERSDINEEVSRLRSHLDLFKETCQSDDQAGRRLEFLTQEMLREANTIASKANSTKISHHVVEIKVAIDRLKEQVQNVE